MNKEFKTIKFIDMNNKNIEIIPLEVNDELVELEVDDELIELDVDDDFVELDIDDYLINECTEELLKIRNDRKSKVA